MSDNRAICDMGHDCPNGPHGVCCGEPSTDDLARDLVRKLRTEWPVGPGNMVACQIMVEAADLIEALKVTPDGDAFMRGIAFGQQHMPRGTWEVVDSPEVLALRADRDAWKANAERLAEAGAGYLGAVEVWGQGGVSAHAAGKLKQALAAHTKQKDGEA